MSGPRILIAPGPYKECLSSFAVARAMERGVKEILPTAVSIIRPLCDGGSGIAEVLTEATAGRLARVQVDGPIGQRVEAEYGLLGDGRTAVVESAKAAGLALVPRDRRNPLRTSSFGVGQLLAHAASSGAKEIIVGCGDSGTNDCGMGCAAALGVRFFDADSKPILYPRGEDLRRVARIDPAGARERLAGSRISVACNLTSILSGPEGTSRIYGPQKGATKEDVEILQSGVDHFVKVVLSGCGIDLSYVPGAGGAGGLAASLYAFCGARLLYSIDVVDRYLNLDQHLASVDLVLTGEGRIDDRTATGKVPCGIALKAKRYNLPVVAVVGSIADDHEDIFYNGIDAVESIAEGPQDLEYLVAHAEMLIQRAATRVMRFAFDLLAPSKR